MGIGDFMNWLLGRLKRVRVAGFSMEPTLRDGQTVLVNYRAYASVEPVVGDVVLAQWNPASPYPTIKRIVGIETNHYILRGDNPAQSTDSAELGPLSHDGLLGRVACSFP